MGVVVCSPACAPAVPVAGALLAALMLTRPATDVPVVPDAEEARRWAQEELARGIYTERTGLLQRFLEWVIERIEDLTGLSVAGGWVLPVVLVLVTAALVVVALVVGVPGRRSRARAGAGVLEGEDRSADALRAAAAAAAARGDHAAAVLEGFRAIVRGLAERALLDEVPGLTAREAALLAGGRLPALATDLASAATLFDGVRYGHVGVGGAEAAWLAALDRRVAAERAEPVPAAAPAEAGSTA